MKFMFTLSVAANVEPTIKSVSSFVKKVSLGCCSSRLPTALEITILKSVTFLKISFSGLVVVVSTSITNKKMYTPRIST